MKRAISILIVAMLVLSCMPTMALADSNVKAEYTYYVISPEQMDDMGGWKFEQGDVSASFRSQVMMDKGDGEQEAKVNIVLPHDGDYRIFVHTRDYDTQTGTRTSLLSVDGFELGLFGNHRKHGYEWQAFDATGMSAGEQTMTFSDGNKNARFDMVFVTDDPEFVPENTTEALNRYENTLLFDASEINVIESDPMLGRPQAEIAVKLNGKWMEFDVNPVIMNDRTLVPFRAIFEALGCAVSWDDENQTAIGTRNGLKIELPIGKNVAYVSGNAKELDQPAVLINERTLVPLRFVSEALGANVNWVDETQSVIIRANIPPEAAFLTIQSFHDVGTWIVEENGAGAFNEQAMRGVFPSTGGNTAADADASDTKPAVANFTLATGGTYRVWARSKDFDVQQGTRFFQIGFNDMPMMEHKYGTHGFAGYAWATGGTVELPAGQNTLYLYDTSGYYARCDAIFITKDLDFEPLDSYELMEKIALPPNAASSRTPLFPNYAKEQNVPTESVTIENENTKVVFYKVPTSKGQVVQNEIYSKKNGEWIKTNNREEPHGYMVLYAGEASATTSMDVYGLKSKNVTADGEVFGGLTYNSYAGGLGEWMIPTDVSVAGNVATLTFPDSQNGKLTVTWTLDAQAQPLVAMQMTFAKDGYYSFAGFEGGELLAKNVEYICAPFRLQYKRIPEAIELYNEQYLFTPMGTYSLPENNSYSQYPITKGVVAESTDIPLRWVNKDNFRLGIAVKSQNNLCQGGIFDPVIGTKESMHRAGDTYTMRYRVVSSVGSWFENYEKVITNLFEVTDYRKNWNNNLNAAIFNTRDLMMDDVYSGWSEADKSHWNMEGQWATSASNPMQALQEYLLTEDEEILTKRAIPTIANYLTRKSIHFNSHGIKVETSGWNKKYTPDPIGEPISGFNANVVGGMYEMSRGGIPFLQKYAVEKGMADVDNSYGSVAPFSNDLNLYKYTGDKKYLDSAIQKADAYLADVVYAESTEIPDWQSFIYISYYPNLASLIDIYEVTKDKKYLDAAENVAQWMTTGLWVPGVTTEQRTEKVTVNDLDFIRNYGAYDEDNISFWWMGEKQFRIGRTNNILDFNANNENITSRTREMDGWIASRVGLGVEQASTFMPSRNIVMESFVGDFMKLAGYTDNDFYATIARNAIVGRFNGYEGYYRSGFTTYEQETDYARQGPDYNLIYWHHIPPFLAMLEDFLIGQTFAWSDGKIEFPSLRQQGYAYFNSNQYGHAPGKFFDESDMWLWLDEEIMTSDSIQIDWLAARKNGVLGLALMNEDDVATTTEIILGKAVSGSANYNGTATLYDETGKIGTTEVVNGKFTVTIPAKSLQAVVITVDGVKEPQFATMDYEVADSEIGATVSEHKNGKGYTLQVSPQNYYAYVYVTDMPQNVQKLEMSYKVGKENKTVSTDVYPYEFIIEVDDVNADFNYSLTVTDKAGNKLDYGKGVLMTAQKSAEKGIIFGESSSEVDDETTEAVSFPPFVLEYLNQGTNDSGIRFVVALSSLPFEPNAQNVRNLPVSGKVIDGRGKEVEFTSKIIGYEPRDDKNCTLIMANTDALEDYKGTSFVDFKYEWQITVSPLNTNGDFETAKDLKFEPFALQYVNQGSTDTTIRFVVNESTLPFTPTKTNVNGLVVKGKVVEEGGKSVDFETVLTGYEARDGGLCTLVMKPVPAISEYKGVTVAKVPYTWEVTVYPVE